MESLDSMLRFKIQIIVEKLQELECTLLGNKDDAWIMELLFKPGFHRFHLIEWMLSKLGYDIGKMSGPQNSPEGRMKKLQLTVSGLGICRENSHDVIKGTAEVKEQLEFWCQLTEIIWLKHQLTLDRLTETAEGVSFLSEKSKRNLFKRRIRKHKEFEDATTCIHKICESVNVKHLFKDDFELFSPHVLSELRNFTPSKRAMSKIPSLEQMQENAKEKGNINLKDLSKALVYEDSFHINENDSYSELNSVEEEMSSICYDFKNCAVNSFNDLYNDLKPFIHHAKTDTFTDVGPAFQKLETPLDNLLQLKNSFEKLESSYSKLLNINSDLESILNQDSFSDENYVSILKLVKGET